MDHEMLLNTLTYHLTRKVKADDDFNHKRDRFPFNNFIQIFKVSKNKRYKTHLLPDKPFGVY